jgi:hypothetical protein
MVHLAQVVRDLVVERKRIEIELERVTNALSALNRFGAKASPLRNRPTLSASARARIAAAQRARWAKWRKANKKSR